MFSIDTAELILSAVAVLVTLTVHEYAHGYVAYKLGDSTAKNFGRLTLNPIRHIDLFGAICMLLFHFGWAKPVPINPRNFKKPRRDFALVAAAGPISNIIMAFLLAPLFLLMLKTLTPEENVIIFNLKYNLANFLGIFFSVNIGLGIFNLIPIPPFDGSRILNLILPPKAYFAVMKHERKIYWALIIWLFFGDTLYRALIGIPFVAASPVLSAIASVFSLSLHLSRAVGFISNAILSFWQLIPFLR